MAELKLYCCGCKEEVFATLTNGIKIYPHRKDLHSLPFWECNTCNNYVGCHHKTNQPTKPLGNIPTPELRKARGHIHAILDPLWKTNKIHRAALYSKVSKALGYQYHTAEIKNIEEAREVYKIVKQIAATI